MVALRAPAICVVSLGMVEVLCAAVLWTRNETGLLVALTVVLLALELPMLGTHASGS